MPPRAGVRPEMRWRHEAVLRVLLEYYCVEPRFDCWESLERMGAARSRPAAQLSATYGTLGTAAAVLGLLLLACGCCVRGGAAGAGAVVSGLPKAVVPALPPALIGVGGGPVKGKYKRDHIV